MPATRTQTIADIWTVSDLTILDTVDQLWGGVVPPAVVDAAAIADALNVYRRSLAPRLSWMSRRKLIRKDRHGNWTITATGRKCLQEPRLLEVRSLAQHFGNQKSGVGWVAAREWKRQ